MNGMISVKGIYFSEHFNWEKKFITEILCHTHTLELKIYIRLEVEIDIQVNVKMK